MNQLLLHPQYLCPERKSKNTGSGDTEHFLHVTLKSMAIFSPAAQKGRNLNLSYGQMHLYVFVSTFNATLKTVLNAHTTAQDVGSSIISTTFKD